MHISCVGNYEHREGKCCLPGPTWVWKRGKKYVQYKIEGFCDQSIVNKIFHQIMIILQKTITKVPLYAWLITPFLTFEWPKIAEDNCQHVNQSGCHRFCPAVNTCWPHKRSYRIGKRGTICPITRKHDVQSEINITVLNSLNLHCVIWILFWMYYYFSAVT